MRKLECCSRWATAAGGALPSARIRQFGSILPWASPHVPCQTLGAIRDHYDFVFGVYLYGSPWLPRNWLCYRRAIECILKNFVKRDQCKALTLGKIFILL